MSVIKECKYTHPARYKGVKSSSEQAQLITRLRVETNCLKCSEFMGREHDFSECSPIPKKCPKSYKGFSLIAPEQFIKCEVTE